MGNRANVVFCEKDDATDKITPVANIYLHWNGGAESIFGFMKELKRRKVRIDAQYAAARFIHVVCDHHDQSDRGAGGLSVGLMKPPPTLSKTAIDKADNGTDNGVFIFIEDGQDWEMRRFVDGRFLSPEDVEKEWVAAGRHPYNSGANRMEVGFIQHRPIIAND